MTNALQQRIQFALHEIDVAHQQCANARGAMQEEIIHGNYSGALAHAENAALKGRQALNLLETIAKAVKREKEQSAFSALVRRHVPNADDYENSKEMYGGAA